MRPDDFRALLQVAPFRPLRVTLTDGRTYDITHPEFAMVGRSVVVIGTGAPADRIADRMTTVSLLHIMQVEPIESAA